MNTQPAVETSGELNDELMDSLLADLGLSEDDIVIKADDAEKATPVEIDIEPATPVVTAEPVTAEPVTAEPAPVEKEKKQKKTKAKKASNETPEAPKEKMVRKHYASKSERLADKFGDKLNDYLVLEVSDATLEGEALETKQDETLAIINGAGKKVQNRITFIIEFIGGKSAKLNGIVETAFKMLHNEGKLTMGNEGNLQKALVAHPYSVSAAKAMGGNTILAMAKLKVVQKDETGDYVANPNSLVLAAMNSMLGLGT